jgi:hypothetical protein
MDKDKEIFLTAPSFVSHRRVDDVVNYVIAGADDFVIFN